jgi:glycosyltransferase involved in cell wall biosynthesis
MVVGAYFPVLAGGSLQCRTLVLALRDHVRFTVLTTTAVEGVAERSNVDGVAVYRVFIDPRRRWTKLAGAWQMTRLVRRLARERDIFHFHGFTEEMLLLYAVARLSGRRTVEKLTSLGWDDPVAIRRRFGRLFSAAQRRVDRIVAMTPALRERCRIAGVPAAKVVAIPNGVDIERFTPADAATRLALRSRLGLPGDSCLVTFVGFWSSEKGAGVLFDAWRLAGQQSGVKTSLLFIGSTDPTQAEVSPTMVAAVRAQIEREGMEQHVRWLERTEDVAPYLRASDVFALPSSREGLSNALLEAMAAGLPCVCARIPDGTDDLIESGVNGWVVPPGDRDSLARVLTALLKNGDTRAAAGARARQTIVDRFAMTAVVDRYLAMYRELIGEPA